MRMAVTGPLTGGARGGGALAQGIRALSACVQMVNQRMIRLLRSICSAHEADAAYGAHELHTRLDGVRQRCVMPVHA